MDVGLRGHSGGLPVAHRLPKEAHAIMPGTLKVTPRNSIIQMSTKNLLVVIERYQDSASASAHGSDNPIRYVVHPIDAAARAIIRVFTRLERFYARYLRSAPSYRGHPRYGCGSWT